MKLWPAIMACSLFSCTLLNAPDEDGLKEICDDGRDNNRNSLVDCADPFCTTRPRCQETSSTTCQDGLDNDLDEAVDCEDPDCFEVFECVHLSPWVRQTACPVSEPEVEFTDPFDASIDLERWYVTSTCNSDRTGCHGPFDYPVIEGEGWLFLNGQDSWRSTGLISTTSVSLGRERRFVVEVHGELEADCEHRPGTRHFNGCNVQVDFQVAPPFTDTEPWRPTVFGATLLATTVPTEFAYTCRHRQQDIARGTVQLDTGPLVFRMQNAGTGDPATITINSREICSAQLVEREPTAHLAMISTGGPRSGGRLRIDSVHLQVDGERPSNACELSQGLLPDRYCEDSFFNTGKIRPQVARTPDGVHHMVFSGNARFMTVLMGQTHSPNGRTRWSVADVERPLLATTEGINWNHGALISHGQQLLLWLDEEPLGSETPMYQGPSMYRAPYDNPRQWEHLGTLNFQVREGLEASWVPQTVVSRDGKFEAFDSTADGILRASSPDGLVWTFEDIQFPESEIGEWDHGRPVRPVVTWTGDYYIMAYSARPFSESPRIGLAFSRDGRQWTRHAANPLVVPRTHGFDDAGVIASSIDKQGSTIRIWYSAESAVPGKLCGLEALDVARPRRLGVAELVLESHP